MPPYSAPTPEAQTLTAQLEKTGTQLEAKTEGSFSASDEVTIAVRPEKISVSQERPEGDNLTITKGTVEDLAYYGKSQCLSSAEPVGVESFKSAHKTISAPSN